MGDTVVVTNEGAVELPAPCVVVLVGPGAAGKSTWAAAHFAANAVVSSDRMRALVGTAEDDIAASKDALEVLEDVVRRRLSRRLTTVIDTLGLDADRRQRWRDLASAQGMPCVAVTFDVSAEECRTRNRNRVKRIPAAALSQQLRSWARARQVIADEGFHSVIGAAQVRLVRAEFATASASARRQAESPTGLRFGLHLSSFAFGAGDLAASVRTVATAAEEVGFDAIYVMDHFRQIPQVGRAWEDFPESFTTISYVAACTARVRVGVLVAGVTYRNPAHLGKIVASLDVLSGGRAVCGLGLAWYAEEHAAYGWPFPSVRDRYTLLEDTLQLLPILWGPGSPAFKGRVLSVPEAFCYPRPLQQHVPIILGGGGEKRTLRLAAQYADAANVFGNAATVRRKAEVLRAHCREVGRDPSEVAMTQLSTVLVGADPAEVDAEVERLRPRRQDPGRYAASVHAGTITDHVGRFRELAEAGASEVVVRLADPASPAAMDCMAKVIAAFR